MTARCALCARPLHRPSPDGYGPRCRRKLAVPTAGRADVPTPGIGHVPGQTAIRIPPWQMALSRPPYPGDHTWRGRQLTDIDTGGLT
jgi:hypothetical protein